MKEQLIELIKQSHFNGVCYIHLGGATFIDQGFGFANFEHKVKNSSETVFRIASISKQFVAAAILKLVETNQLSLQEPLSSFFPEFQYGNRITIHHLLTNSSGIVDFPLDMDFYDILQSEDILQGLIDLGKDKELLFEPGSQFYYSIPSYLMLHKIVEILTKKDLEQFLKESFFNALHMQNTGLEKPNRLIPNKAGSYALDQDKKIVLSRYIDMRIAGGAGGFFSTTHDLHRWNQFLYSQSGIFKQMFQEQIYADDHNHYGYGLIVGLDDTHGKDRLYYYHSGGGPGVRSIVMYYPKENIEVILISNLEDKDTFNRVQNLILDTLLS